MTRASSTNTRGNPSARARSKRIAVLGSMVRPRFLATRSNQEIVTQPRAGALRIAHSQGCKAYPGGLGAVVVPGL
jgi:hypothetical protein